MDVIIVKIEAKIYALVVDHELGLKFIDVTNPYNPEQVGSIDTTRARSVSIMEKDAEIYAVVADGANGLVIV